MKFISPKIDYAFKKIFGSDQSEDILISFLNAIVYNGESVISSLTIVNPYNPGQVETLKDSYLDIRAILNSGEIVLIEMQVARVAAFHKRVTYNLCKAYANQLASGDYYLEITPVIAVTITDFILFKESHKCIHHFVFKDKESSSEYPEHELQLIFLELPRFVKKLPELQTLAEKWIYFMTQAQDLEEIPESLAEVTAIEKALTIANQANLTPAEAEEVSRRAMQLRDEIGRIKYATEEAREEALEEGRQAGRQAGRQEGRQEGRITEARALVLRLLNKRFPDKTAELNSLVEGLSLSALEELSDAMFELNNWEDLLTLLADIDQ
ncbi:Rpn family recombination-promoting nuclease/putative transposase [Coleofasciculus sp. G2-EDA-02]|uniref:Rpn family recombination-promoting nuclease/putative transposase n=1 Tax=Coleofasciculus sp. G2-EDA-02 TaxID=3069529 RepID=UPI003303AF23